MKFLYALLAVATLTTLAPDARAENCDRQAWDECLFVEKTQRNDTRNGMSPYQYCAALATAQCETTRGRWPWLTWSSANPVRSRGAYGSSSTNLTTAGHTR